MTTRFGLLTAESLVGHKYGTQFNCKRGWIIPLQLSPQLWTRQLPHRTQILYDADISLILLKLDIKPNCLIAESGTGSGSLSHSTIRSCLPNGHLHTFDICQERVQTAKQEFCDHQIDKNVTIYCRDVCADGFPEILNESLDACILDLPKTWDAIEAAKKVLKPHSASKICTFSPCIEQVQKNVQKMTELNFENIETVECVVRNKKVEEQTIREWTENNGFSESSSTKRLVVKPASEQFASHSGYLTFATLK